MDALTSESWAELPLPICEVQTSSRCLSPYAAGDLTRPNRQPGHQRLGVLRAVPTADACPTGPARPLLPGEETAALNADAKQQKIFLKLQHLALWQPPPAGGPGVLELPLGASHGLASDHCLGL